MLINASLAKDFPFEDQYIWEDLSRNFRLSVGKVEDFKPFASGRTPKDWTWANGLVVCKSYRFAMLKKQIRKGGCASAVVIQPKPDSLTVINKHSEMAD